MPGRIIINTGDGKGKTTAAMGTAVRALGRGHSVGIFQFIKGSMKTGETEALMKLGADFFRLGQGFVGKKETRDDDRAMAIHGWEKAKAALKEGVYKLVVLDELNYVIGFGMIDAVEVAETLRTLPDGQNVIITGRGLHAPLVKLADTVTEMKMIKHAYIQGIEATRGIEF